MTQQSTPSTMTAYRREDGACVLMLSAINAEQVKTGSIDLQLAYAGRWEKDGTEFELNDEIMDELIASVSDVRADVPSDYEHMMFDKSSTAEQKKASGWMKAGKVLTKRDGENGPELWTTWKPTKTARAYIENDEYRYPSIAFLPRKDGKPAKFLNFTLTTQPFLDGVPPIQCSRETTSMPTEENKPTEPVTAGEPVAEEKPKDEPVTAAEDVPGDVAAEAVAVVDMYAKGWGVDAMTALKRLKDEAEKTIAAGQTQPVQASAAPAANEDEAKKLSRKLEEATLLNKSLNDRYAQVSARLDARDKQDADKRKSDEIALFTRDLDGAITECKVHEAERDQALALFAKLPEEARAIYLSRTHTVVPRNTVPAEPNLGVKTDASGRVIVELSRLSATSLVTFNTLTEQFKVPREKAFTDLMQKQNAVAAA